MILFNKLLFTCLFISIFLISCTGNRFQGSGWASPLVDNDQVFIATIDGELISIDLGSGKEKWRATSLDDENGKYNSKAIYSKPFVFDEKVFIGTPAGRVLGFNKLSGLDEVSLQDIEEKILMSEESFGPIIVGNIIPINKNKIIVPSSNGEISIFSYNESEMFEPTCNFKAKDAIWTTPVIDPNSNQIIFGSMDGNLYSVDEECKLNWQYNTESSIVGTPILDKDEVYFGTLNRTFYSLNISTGELIWKFDNAKGWFWASPIMDSNIIYAPNLDGSIYALRKNNGQIMWTYDAKHPIVSSPVVIDDFLIFVTKNGELQVIHKESKRKLGNCDIDHKIYSAIENYEDMIFIQVSDGSVRGYKIKKNGNPDELWAKPFFTPEDDDRNNEDWDPSC
jgi:outer membrane protein assembly factor BamB